MSAVSDARPMLGRILLTIPLVLVNGAAVWGQGGWAYEHITPGGRTGVAIALLFALAVECTGAYLAWEAHEARLADRAYMGLQLFSYTVGAFAGVLNYAHFSDTNVTQAWTFGVMSALSPWLWGVYSRAQNTERLDALGLLDARGVKLSTIRKILWPTRSWHVVRDAAWIGETRPDAAVEGWERDYHPDLYQRRLARRHATARADVVAPVMEEIAPPSQALSVGAPAPAPAVVETSSSPSMPSRSVRPLWSPAVGSDGVGAFGVMRTGRSPGRSKNGHLDTSPGSDANGEVPNSGGVGRTQDDSQSLREENLVSGSGASGPDHASDPVPKVELSNGFGDGLTNAEFHRIKEKARTPVLTEGAGRTTVLRLISEEFPGRQVSAYWPRKVINAIREEARTA